MKTIIKNMTLNVFSGYLLSVICVCVFVVTVYADGNDDETLDQFTQSMKQWKSEILDNSDSFYIKCDRLHVEDVLKSQYSGGDIPVSWELAWSGRCFFVKRTFFPTEEQKKSKVVSIPEQPTTLVLKQGNLVDWHQEIERCYVDTLNDVMINMINEWTLFEFLGLNVAEKIISSSGLSYADVCTENKTELGYDFLSLLYFPETLVNNGTQYTVKQEKETVDGHNCVVIEWPGRDVLWVDPGRHWLVRKRTVFTESKQEKYTVNYQNYQEIKPDVWFPSQLTVDIYADTAVEPKTHWGKIAKRWVYNVQEIKTSDQPASLFDIFPPPGTIVIDGIRKMEYSISDPNTDPFAGPIEQGIKVNRFAMRRALSIIIGSILILIAIWLLLRNTEKK